MPPLAFRAHLRHARPSRSMRMSGWLTPYTIEGIIAEARTLPAGGRLEIDVPPATNEHTIGRIDAQFQRLKRRGVLVRVRRTPNRGHEATPLG